MTETITGKEKILETALVEFADKGYEGARVDRIALKAGVNKALIYYHFKSKEELYVSTINFLFKKSAPTELEIPAFITVREKILLLIKHFTTFIHHNPVFVKLMDQAVNNSNSLFDNLYEQNQYFQMVLALYFEGVAKGEIRSIDEPVDYLISLLGSCYFFYSHRNALFKFYSSELNEEEFLEMRIRTVQDIVDRVLFQH